MEMDGNQKFDPPGCEELDIPISVGVDHPTTPDVAEAVVHGMATPTSTAHTDVSLDFVRWVSATRVSAVGETGSARGSLASRCVCSVQCASCTCVFATCERKRAGTLRGPEGAQLVIYSAALMLLTQACPWHGPTSGSQACNTCTRIWDNHAVTHCSEWLELHGEALPTAHCPLTLILS
jgi:hypothetical protein